MKVYKASTIEQLPAIAKTLLAENQQSKIYCFDAEMGAGKTTFIKHLCAALGYNGNVTSPTFTIINEYINQPKLIHIDCYRLKDAEEATSIGMEDYLNLDICFIEWAILIKKLLYPPYYNIKIEVLPNQERVFSIELITA